MYFPRERRVPVMQPTPLAVGSMVRVYVDQKQYLGAKFVYQGECEEYILYDYMNTETFIVENGLIRSNTSGLLISRIEEQETCQELFMHDGVLSYNTETFETKMEYVRIKAGDKIKVYMNCQFSPRQEEATVVFCNDDFLTVVCDGIPFTFSRREVMCKNIVHVSNDGIRESCRINEDVFVGIPSEVSKN
ncbi:hypothetical protein VH12019_00278 [Vibrio phage VH1_2019]|uniref:Uncharacterized protein n=1 Tax=Vibrio phage VH1_2019 TaxID=2686307 RepID=A0A6B9SW76_9CAUD|nr:hypothetical protein VH12019_00278 [Vibrio phage VH1_2019]